MEKSKSYKEILDLGKLLVKELNPEHSVDTLGRWMAHHISELIIEAEKTEGKGRADVMDRCCEAVLALWQHARFFPREHRPIENVEPLLTTIRALDPKNQGYFYRSEAQSQIENSTLSEQAKNWLKLSLEIDSSARLLIKICLENAANDITEENSDLIEVARSLDVDTPITHVLRTLTSEDEKSEEEQKTEVIHDAIKNLRNRRDKLRKMIEMSELVATSIDNDIGKMEQSLRGKKQ